MEVPAQVHLVVQREGGQASNSYEVIDELIVGTVGHREYF